MVDQHDAPRPHRPERTDQSAAGYPYRDPHARSATARWVCRVLGVVFILMALIGFVGQDTVLGIFTVNAMHNWVLLLSGIITLALGFATEAAARTTCWVFAAIYGLLMILGFARVPWAVETFNIDMVGPWIHLIVALVFALGAGTSHAQERSRAGVVAREGRGVR
ncbi:MAG: DUF4383 domain-containing protein [Phycisphaeraceae bacterium]